MMHNQNGLNINSNNSTSSSPSNNNNNNNNVANLTPHIAYWKVILDSNELINQVLAGFKKHITETFVAKNQLGELYKIRQDIQKLTNPDAITAIQKILNDQASHIIDKGANLYNGSNVIPQAYMESANIKNVDNAHYQAAKRKYEAADTYRKYVLFQLTTPAHINDECKRIDAQNNSSEITKTIKQTLIKTPITNNYTHVDEATKESTNRYDATIDEADEVIEAGKEDYTSFVSSLGTKNEIYYAATLAQSPETPKRVKEAIIDILKSIPYDTLADDEKDIERDQQEAIKSAHRRLKYAYDCANKLEQEAKDQYIKERGQDKPDTKLTPAELAAQEAHDKDNRLWYDVSKWTWPEIIGRLVAVPYAILCGLSIEASLVNVGAGALFAGLSAFVSASVNLKGFWLNVSTMLTDFFSGTKNSPKGIYRVIYITYAIVFGLTLALLNTAMTLENVRETFRVSGDGFWETFYIPIIFGGTFVALWGLFVQEQFKWLSNTTENGKEFTPWMRLKRTIGRLLGIEKDPNLLLEHELGVENAQASKLARGGRLVLTLVLTAVLAYGAYVIAPIISETFTQGISDFIRHIDFGQLNKSHQGEDPVRGNLLGSTSYAFSIFFVIASFIYGLGLAKRLSDVATRFARGAHDWSPSTILKTCVDKEKSCWQAAVEYGHKERIKGSVIPMSVNICLNFLFQNLTVLVFWNAGNNAGLFVNTKLEDMQDKKAANNDAREEQGLPRESEKLTEKNQLKILGTGASTLIRSAGFGYIATLEGTGGTAKPVTMSQNKTHKLFNPYASNVRKTLV